MNTSKYIFSQMSGYYPSRRYPETLRLVRYWDTEQEREFTFLTNAFHLSSLQVAELYCNRWQGSFSSSGSSST